MCVKKGAKAGWQHGFTMVELVLAVAILFLLIAITVASIYDHQAQKSKRQAINRLHEVAEWLKLQHAHQPNYALLLPADWSGNEEGSPYRISLARAPVTSSDPGVEFPPVGVDTFTLQAVPKTDEECGALLLDQSGRRGVTGAGAKVAACWE